MCFLFRCFGGGGGRRAYTRPDACFASAARTCTWGRRMCRSHSSARGVSLGIVFTCATPLMHRSKAQPQPTRVRADMRPKAGTHVSVLVPRDAHSRQGTRIQISTAVAPPRPAASRTRRPAHARPPPRTWKAATTPIACARRTAATSSCRCCCRLTGAQSRQQQRRKRASGRLPGHSQAARTRTTSQRQMWRQWRRPSCARTRVGAAAHALSHPHDACTCVRVCVCVRIALALVFACAPANMCVWLLCTALLLCRFGQSNGATSSLSDTCTHTHRMHTHLHM